MQALNLPHYPFRLKESTDGWMIFDEVRKKWLVNTPEEWVRQHVVMFLHHQHRYPIGRFQIEGGFNQSGTIRRWDLLVAGGDGSAFLLVECKAPEIPLNQGVFDQAFQYNRELQAPFILISNGMDHFVAAVNEEGMHFLPEVPAYPI